MTSSLDQFLWTLAGVAVGGIAVIWLRTFVLSRRAADQRAQQQAAWKSLQQAILAVDEQPDDPATQQLLQEQLDAASDDPNVIQLVADSLNLRPHDPGIRHAVRVSKVSDQLQTELDSGDSTRQFFALELIGQIGGEQYLSSVRLLAVSKHHEVRRSALQALEVLDSRSAIDLLVRSIRTEGLWAYGQLERIIRRVGIDEWIEARGSAALVDTVSFVATSALKSDEPTQLAAVNLLGAIHHRVALQALGRLTLVTGAVSDAATQALSFTPSGRSLLNKLDVELNFDAATLPNVRPAELPASAQTSTSVSSR